MICIPREQARCLDAAVTDFLNHFNANFIALLRQEVRGVSTPADLQAFVRLIGTISISPAE